MNKVLFHLNEENKWLSVSNNVKNIIVDLEKNNEKFHIVVLVNGNAVLKLVEADTNNLIKSFNNNLVSFQVCNNSLEGYNVNKDLILSSLEIVSSGAYQILKLQQKDYYYIKP